ncbi:hypothetical protein ACROYT_G040105 [Oculina patagonica]
MPDNRVLAEQRLYLLKKKFLRDQEFFGRYKGTINDYITKGYAQRVPKEELSADGKPLWYLPHHAVFHPQKPEKLRVVFDCAARYQGTSLNDQLLHGPDLTNCLFGVLVRFLQETIALSSDIEAMFHQVNVDPNDFDALRFLWWPEDDSSKQPAEYRMVIHLFGSTSLPSCASFGLRRTAQDNTREFPPEVIDTVFRNFYVDDCLKSVPSTEEAIRLREDLSELLERGGFRLTKWSCNKKEVLETIPTSDIARSLVDLDLNADALPIERTLGIHWNMESDMLTFKIGLCVGPQRKVIHAGIRWKMMRQLEDLDHADDIALISSTWTQAQTKLERLGSISEGTGLKINIDKTNVLRLDARKQDPIKINGTDVITMAPR